MPWVFLLVPFGVLSFAKETRAGRAHRHSRPFPGKSFSYRPAEIRARGAHKRHFVLHSPIHLFRFS